MEEIRETFINIFYMLQRLFEPIHMAYFMIIAVCLAPWAVCLAFPMKGTEILGMTVFIIGGMCLFVYGRWFWNGE